MKCGQCGAENRPGSRGCLACAWPLVLPLGPRSVVASRYAIESPLGWGGMGFVFRAHDRTLDETVALKVHPRRDPTAAHRFRSEIKLARKVRHRNVCGIHEYGEEGDLAYIAMEYIEGKDLKRLLQERGAMPWEEAYDVVLQIGEGLQAIHQAGVLHRDLKPANVMRDPRGTARVMDFGIATLWGRASGPRLTGSGEVVGSPEYMSPEQARGQDLDFASDVYSYGVLVYEVFTGRVPFRRETPMATILAHLEEDPPLDGQAVDRVPAALLPVLGRMLAKRAADRYPGCAPLLDAVRQARHALDTQLTDALSTGGLPRPAAPPAPPPPASARPGAPLLPARPDVVRLLREPLRRALRHPDASVREGAAAALAAMADPEDGTLEPGSARSDLGAAPAASDAAASADAARSRRPLAVAAVIAMLVLALVFWLVRILVGG